MRGEARRRRRERRAFEEFDGPDETWAAVSPHIDAALASLKEGDREAVLLRFAGGMSLAEVGKTLGVEENAARMRVARALERMRAHLRRAGVGVAALLLASLLSTRLADAEPLPFVPPSSPARGAARPFPWPAGGGAFAVGVVLVGGLLYGVVARRWSRPVAPAEARALFARSEGGWSGTLEYADDRTGERITTDTTVGVERFQGGLRLVARYSRFDVVDTTTILPQAQGYQIRSFGSHSLDGVFDLVRSGGGAPTFEGFSTAPARRVRLRFQTTADALTISEEYERDGAFRFRNRYDLARVR